MQQNATPPAKQACELSSTQAAALEALPAGGTVTEATFTGGVDRTMVHRRMSEPVFLAAYNSRRREMREAAEPRLQRLQTKTLEAVERAWTRWIRVSP